MLTIIVMIMIITIMIQLEDFKNQSDHYFVYNLAVASCCPMSVPKIYLEPQASVWW